MLALRIDVPLFKIVVRPLLPVKNSWVDATPFVILFFLLVGAWVALRRGGRVQWLRRASQIGAALLFVIFLHRCLCMLRGWVFALNKVGRDNVIAFGYLCVFVLLVSLTLLLGRVFCGWACPMGLALETLGWFARQRQRLSRRWRLVAGYLLLTGTGVLVAWLAYLVRPGTQYFSENIAACWGAWLLLLLLFAVPLGHRDGRLRKVRYVSLGIWVFMSVVGVFVTNPWCTLYGDELDYSSMVALVSVLLAGTIISMAWCRYLCPMGAALGWLQRFSPMRLTNARSCNRCGECRAVCPMGALDDGRIDQSSCIYCAKCIGTCGFAWKIEAAGATGGAASRAPAPPLPEGAGGNPGTL